MGSSTLTSLRTAALAIALGASAAALAACGNGAAGGAVPGTGAPSGPAFSGRALSPYDRDLGDGTIVHVYLPPSERPLLQPDLTGRMEYHGGPIVAHSTVYVIFWQPTGSYVDAKYQSVIEQYLSDVGGTPQYNILTQYYDHNSPIANASTFGGAWTDTSAYPADFNHGATGDKDLRAEVLKAIAINHWPQGGVAPIYAILTASHSPADRWAACAYHSSFGSGGNAYVYTIVPYQHDYGAHGCGTPTNVWPNDRDADQTIDTLWHEQAEATSDPLMQHGAWYSTKTGAEIGDVCQTKYGPLRSDGSDTTLHAHNYITQQVWSDVGNKCRQTMP